MITAGLDRILAEFFRKVDEIINQMEQELKSPAQSASSDQDQGRKSSKTTSPRL